MNKFIKLATFNFYLIFVAQIIYTFLGLSLLPNVPEGTSIPLSELPIYIAIPIAFFVLSIVPVWFWVLRKMFINKYFVWFLIILFLPPLAFFVTNKHYNV